MSKQQCRQVVDSKPVGSYVMVEILEPQEVLNTALNVMGAKVETPQAYILAVGPSLDTSKWGVGVGDRVVLSTPAFVPLPKCDGQRQRGIVDVSAIKAVLVESDELQKSESAILIVNSNKKLIV